MHLAALLASNLAIILTASSTVLAQFQPPPLSSTCLSCLVPAAIVRSKSCSQTILGTFSRPAKMTPEELACFCPLTLDVSPIAKGSTWFDACSTTGVGACPYIEDRSIDYRMISMWVDVCSKLSAYNNSTITTGTASNAGNDGMSMAGLPSQMVVGAAFATTIVSAALLF